MKAFNIFLFLTLSAGSHLFSQTSPHQPAAPPLNPGYSFTRSMFVDCADDIVYDISNGNQLGLAQQLHNYIQNNFIGYIILCGLEYSPVFGNPALEDALRTFIRTTRQAFPQLQIGIGGSDEAFFQHTPYLRIPDDFARICFPNNFYYRSSDAERHINDAGQNNSSLQRSELSKFLFRAAFFQMDKSRSLSSPCNKAFDALYLQYRYWNVTSSLAAMQTEFENYKRLLSIMQLLKCNYTCIDNIDAEFAPTEMFNQLAWTAIDQITEADPLIDRMVVPSFTDNVNSVYNASCKTYHFLADRFSKPGTKIFAGFSAESSSFNYCNSTQSPNNYLGDYLNGTVSPNGNMYSVERAFINKFNNTTYICPDCHCRTYEDNHYSTNLPYANVLAGSMWTTYSLLRSNNLYKSDDATETIQLPNSINLISMEGKILAAFSSIEEKESYLKTNKLNFGVYFLRSHFKSQKTTIEKIAIIN